MIVSFYSFATGTPKREIKSTCSLVLVKETKESFELIVESFNFNFYSLHRTRCSRILF